jgi:putative ABC transport system ATP-binding protein
MILLEGINRHFGDTPVLRDVTLTIGSGEFVAVMGSSGSGKSTLLNLIGGMDRPDSGHIVIGGDDITRYTDEQLTLHRRKRIGFIFQFFNLLPNITVLENVHLPLLLNGIDDEQRAADFLGRVGLGEKASAYPYQLSGGEQQRVAIVRALIHDPAIILADEPTGSLDSRTGESIMKLICGVTADSGKTLVLVTHEQHIAAYAGRIVRIRDGSISE